MPGKLLLLSYMNRLLISLILFFSLGLPVQAVEMRLTGVDGSVQQLSDFRGKWVVVNYWATWCPPCIEEMPELQAFHDDNEAVGAVVIGINSEVVSREKLLEFLDDYFITYPVFTSPPQFESELGSIPGLPTTFLVSPSGSVEAREVGGVTREMIEKFIEKWEAQQLASQDP
jgi:thiol-disulfide isomerase/thioredoxin